MRLELGAKSPLCFGRLGLHRSLHPFGRWVCGREGQGSGGGEEGGCPHWAGVVARHDGSSYKSRGSRFAATREEREAGGFKLEGGGPALWSGMRRVASREGLLGSGQRTGRVSASCCGMRFASLVVTSEDSFWGHAAGRLAGDGLAADNGRPDLQGASRVPITSNPRAYNQQPFLKPALTPPHTHQHSPTHPPLPSASREATCGSGPEW